MPENWVLITLPTFNAGPCWCSQGMTHRGVIEKIENEYMTVRGDAVVLKDLAWIGRKRRGSGIKQQLCIYFGTLAIFTSLLPPPDPCRNCQQVSNSTDNSYKVLGVAVGAAIIGLGLVSEVRNTPKDVILKWKLEVVD